MIALKQRFGPSIALCMLALIATPATAESPASEPRLTQIELQAEGRSSVANDLGQALAYVEMSDANTAELARRVNQKTAEALAIAKAYPGVKTRTSALQTYPIYGKSGQKIESWRIRAEIQLESRDLPALSELIGRLQNTMAIGQLGTSPSPEAQQKAEDEATVAAIAAFRARAELVARSLGHPWRIRTLALNTDGMPAPRMKVFAARAMAEAAPAPIEAGESTVRISANGTIELLDSAK